MKNNTRKFLCLLLSIMMVFSLLSVNAFAAEEDLSVAGEDFFVEEEAELAVPFPDVKANNSDTSKAIIWGNKNGIIKGSQGYFLPKEKCTRGNVVTFLYRYDQKFG